MSGSATAAPPLPPRHRARLSPPPAGVPTNPSDGNLYMGGQLQYPCGGSTQRFMLFPAVCAFVGYSIVLPAAGLWFLRSKRNIVKYDMVRAQSCGGVAGGREGGVGC